MKSVTGLLQEANWLVVFLLVLFIALAFASLFNRSIDWSNPKTKISKYFTVYEVTKGSSERIPTDPSIQRNIIDLAKKLDQLREAWGSPIGIRSWYRPPTMQPSVDILTATIFLEKPPIFIRLTERFTNSKNFFNKTGSAESEKVPEEALFMLILGEYGRGVID